MEFLNARLDEAERIAVAATHEVALAEDRFGWESVDFNAEENWQHGNLWNPARVLADIAAKRKILELWQIWNEPGPDGRLRQDQWSDAARFELGVVLNQLVTVYRDHPDCDQAWLPEWATREQVAAR